MLPLYEAKMLHLYDTRWATYERDGSTRAMTEDEKNRHENPMPRYWVEESEVDAKLDDAQLSGLLGWRRICRATDARTLVTTLGPRVAYGDSWFMAVSKRRIQILQFVLSSFVLDYVARQKLGGTNMNFFTFSQLPMPSLAQFELPSAASRDGLSHWAERRTDRLNGWIPNLSQRARTQAELDAAAFHLFGLSHEEADYVMETFPIVKRKDIKEHGRYITKELILDAYDAMSEAERTGTLYEAPWEKDPVR